MSIPDDERSRLLSPEEIAAMAEDDYDADADNAAALAEIGRGPIDADADAEDDETGAAAKADAGDGAGERLAAQEPDGTGGEKADEGEGAAAEQQAEGEKAPAAEAVREPQGYQVELPQDYDDQVRANKAAVAELRRKFNDGDLDVEEYDAELDRLQDARAALDRIKTRAEIAAEMREQNERNAWFAAIDTFMADAAAKPELGIVDYAKDADKQADLDTFIKALAGVKANENKPMRWFLEEAHKRVVALHGVPVAKAKGAEEQKRKADVSAVTPTIAEVPGGAGDADPSADEFADLDKLKGPAYERALAALSEEKRQRYLMSA
jgi:hypothetical protein